MASRYRSEGNRENRSAFLREVLLNEPVARKEVAAQLGLNTATMSRIARSLIDSGLVRERVQEPGEGPVRPGPRMRLMSIDPAGGQVLGICIVPTVQTVALADIGRNIVDSGYRQLDDVEDADAVLRRLAHDGRRMIGDNVEDRRHLLGGLVLIVGEVEPTTGAVLNSPYLGWGSFPVRARLSELLNLPMEVRNLTAGITQAEMLFGAARGRGNVLMMLCGPGIGAAVIVDGRVVAASPLRTGGIGKMAFIGEDGTPSTLDDLAGGDGILRRLHGEQAASASPAQSDRELHRAIERDRSGDPECGALMAGAGRELGRLIAIYAGFVRPDIVLISGALAMSPSYLTAIRNRIADIEGPPIEVTASRVTGPEGGWWASCSMAVHEYLVERPVVP